MSAHYETPQDAEDAFYDALEEASPDALMAVWADADDIVCLLPMYPLIRGRQGLADLFAHLFSRGEGVTLGVTHLDWVHTDEIAIHHVEEVVQNAPANRPPPPPLYGTNIYRRQDDGWRLIAHLNAPTPPPQEQQSGSD
jgi:ketosteroid isomerase-like protein